ncbi:hypothetical protein HMPREF9622_02451 [Cutibacterium modestum HL037PA3]|jgi:hypothetical protein|uniref:Uncharacterized protein n=2 Tax=Cutibacterium modestum TaxID=2559073 RepID=A0ABN0C5J2_9ACTN|nr:hypothetical protein HMPREF9621_02261 [Cutibacterium modestum HL037PA2]EFS92451.1 hypothetical protein HMPREF9607_01395 [Cutibacterium modestum HL044PA1]EFT14515.1 hypothetical protein HMPREF9622_02451 [Cutibacterium modestum HL037PA3]EGG27997.1 hypothetical protein PA08_0225 [Cutibacterium modestum P08]
MDTTGPCRDELSAHEEASGQAEAAAKRAMQASRDALAAMRADASPARGTTTPM